MKNELFSAKNVTLKLFSNDDASTVGSLVCTSIPELIERIKTTAHHENYFHFCSSIDRDELRAALKLSMECEPRDGISGGCYGARDGKSYDGFTVYLSPLELPERWIDEDGSECVNYAALLHEHGSYMGEVDDDFIDRAEEMLGLDFTHENSYNYSGSGDGPYSAYEIDFKFYEREDDTVVSFVRFHCGGDVRGNYTGYHRFDFDSKDELYSAIWPMKHLVCESTSFHDLRFYVTAPQPNGTHTLIITDEDGQIVRSVDECVLGYGLEPEERIYWDGESVWAAPDSYGELSDDDRLWSISPRDIVAYLALSPVRSMDDALYDIYGGEF